MWDELSIKDKAAFIEKAVQEGLTDLSDIKDVYNSYAEEEPIERTDIEQGIKDYYSGIPDDKYPVRVVEDNNFNPPGYGNIETMLKEDAIYDGGEYTYKNPYPDENTIVFNNEVKNPLNASILDYLHVLRHEDPEYQQLLQNLHNTVMGHKEGDIYQSAEERRKEDIKRVGKNNVQPLSKYIENEEDGWLRNMFHPGTREELIQDNYYPDRQQLLDWSPDLYEPTREIYNYLHPYELEDVDVYPEEVE